MANPLLNDQRLQQAATATATADGAGWAAPDPATVVQAPITDGPISEWRSGTMTVGGTASATGILLFVLILAATFGWAAVEAPEGEVYQFPTLALVSMLAGFGVAILLAFKPMWAKVLGPIYAIAQGFFLGAISRAYETLYDGIVVQAAGASCSSCTAPGSSRSPTACVAS